MMIIFWREDVDNKVCENIKKNIYKININSQFEENVDKIKNY